MKKLDRETKAIIEMIDLGQDSRGYRFVACAGEPYMIAAGCRWLALAKAKAHWKNNAEARLKIELCEKEAKRRGWVK